MGDERVPGRFDPDRVVTTNYDRLIAGAMGGDGTVRAVNASEVPGSAVVYLNGSAPLSLTRTIDAQGNVKVKYVFAAVPDLSRGLSTSVQPTHTRQWQLGPLSRSLARLPEGDRERYAEEWAADLASIEGPFARWRWQLGIRLTARRLAKPGHAKTRLSNS